MKLSLQGKITGIAVLSALLPVVVIIAITIIQQKLMLEEAEQELDALARDNIAQISKDVYNLCLTTNDLLQERLDMALSYATKSINDKGGLSPTGINQQWQAVNQYSGEITEVVLPAMLLGNKPLPSSKDFSQYIPIVDDVYNVFGVTFTIFQRMNINGDMLRVATNVQDNKNERAIGTYIPYINPDSTENPVIKTVLAGNTYRGRAYVVNQWYLTVYSPLKNSNGEIIGIIYTGEKIGAAKSLRDAIMRINVAKTGYVYILGGKSNPGHYIISKDGVRDGEDILGSKDSDGEMFIKDIVENALKLKDTEVYIKEYNWKNFDESEPRQKVAAICYFEPWDWVIGTGVYKDDYYEAKKQLEEKFNQLLMHLLVYGAAILLLAVVLSVFMSKTISNPIIFVNSIAKRIAEGKLKEAKTELESKVESKGIIGETKETNELLSSFSKMTNNLYSLISQVQQSGIQVTTSATEISASSRQLEATVAEQAASTKEISASSREISSRANALVNNTQRSAETMEKAISTAESGRQMLDELDETMQSLTTATNSISAKLSIISGKADKISGIITAINKISDQTKLLSLNAAIEAEKAGDYGKGFSVVAREISRLAVQTATATKDIEYMVKEMQASVSSGVMEMDKFGKEVKNGTVKVTDITYKIEDIINNVHNLTPEFQIIENGIASQSEGAAQISEAMVHLKEAAEQTKESLTEFRNVTIQLNEAVKGLQKEVSQFKISK